MILIAKKLGSFFFLFATKTFACESWQIGGSDSKESACNVGDLGSIPGLEDPLEKGMANHSSILAWIIPQRSLVDYSPWCRKESDMTDSCPFHMKNWEKQSTVFNSQSAVHLFTEMGYPWTWDNKVKDSIL